MECAKCGKEFARKWNFKRHLNRKTPCDKPKPTKVKKEKPKKYVSCEKCGKTFKNLKRHLTGRKTSCDEKPTCEKCERDFMSRTSLNRHKKTCLNKKASYTPPDVIPKELCFVRAQYAIGKYLRGWRMDVEETHQLAFDATAFLEGIKSLLKAKLEAEIKELGGVKFQMALRVHFTKNEDESEPTFRTKQQEVLSAHEIDDAISRAFADILRQFGQWTQRGSGWQLDRVIVLWLDIATYQPLKGDSYVDLPDYIKNKKAIINVKNEDDDCLRWALRSWMFPAKNHSDRPTSYPTDDLVWTEIDAPTPISQISKVEGQNNIAINVLGLDEKDKVVVYRISKSEATRRVNLLLFRDHYCWIKDLNRLLYDYNAHHERKHFCVRGLHGYSRADILKRHEEDCKGTGAAAVRVDTPKFSDRFLEFKNVRNQMPVPCVIYADFEALVRKIDGPENDPNSGTLRHGSRVMLEKSRGVV